MIVEEGAELHVITGCTTSPHLKRWLHVGIPEFFIKKNAKLSFTMIHNWAEDMVIRPRSVAQVEEGGLYLNNYICMRPVKSLQMYPTTNLIVLGIFESWTVWDCLIFQNWTVGNCFNG